MTTIHDGGSQLFVDIYHLYQKAILDIVIVKMTLSYEPELFL